MNREKIILDIQALKDEQKALKDKENMLWEMLNLSGPGNEVYESVVLQVSEVSRFNAATAKKNLDKNTLDKISKFVPDSALAKATLDEDEYKILCCNQSLKRDIKIVKE